LRLAQRGQGLHARAVGLDDAEDGVVLVSAVGAVDVDVVAAEEDKDKEYKAEVCDEGLVALREEGLDERDQHQDDGKEEVGYPAKKCNHEAIYYGVSCRRGVRAEALQPVPAEGAARQQRVVGSGNSPTQVALHAPSLLALCAACQRLLDLFEAEHALLGRVVGAHCSRLPKSIMDYIYL